MYIFDAQSELTAGYYITPDFSDIFYSFTNHFQQSSIESQKGLSAIEKRRLIAPSGF
jgi:hypothetical protein